MQPRKLSIVSGTFVRVVKPGPVPEYSEWDDDKQRTSTSVKRKLQEQFFRADKRVRGQVSYVGSESLRDRLRAQGRSKVEVRDASGCAVIITVDNSLLQAAS